MGKNRLLRRLQCEEIVQAVATTRDSFYRITRLVTYIDTNLVVQIALLNATGEKSAPNYPGDINRLAGVKLCFMTNCFKQSALAVALASPFPLAPPTRLL